MITALLVSVNYSDYLEAVLPYNTMQFDEIIVLTVESDKACQDVCSKYSKVKCLVFQDSILNKNGKKFNKGAILNLGLEYLNQIGYSDWLVLTDSDILFPENFKELLNNQNKDLNVLYGMNRKHCPDFHTLNSYLETKDNNLLISKRELPFIGFCQIFVYQPFKFKFVESCDCERVDIIFLNYFFEEFVNNSIHEIIKKAKQLSNFILLSTDDFVIHLGESCQNWKGRTTKKFL